MKLEERDPISDLAYRALLDLCMANDPWPCDELNRQKVFAFMNAEARKRDFDGWIAAYHDFDPEE